jgi:hypothetical protein
MNRRVKTGDGLKRIWRTQILPLLKDRHIGEHADVASYVRDRYGVTALLPPAAIAGTVAAAGFLFDMYTVFEDWLTASLRRALEHHGGGGAGVGQ